MEERRRQRELEEATRKREEEKEERRVAMEREKLQKQYKLEILKKKEKVRGRKTLHLHHWQNIHPFRFHQKRKKKSETTLCLILHRFSVTDGKHWS